MTEAGSVHRSARRLTAAGGETRDEIVAEEVAVAQLRGRCAARVCYAPKSTSSGHRAYGHFSMDADALGDAVGRTLAPRLHQAENEPVGLLVLYQDAVHVWPDEEIALILERWPDRTPRKPTKWQVLEALWPKVSGTKLSAEEYNAVKARG